MKFIRLICLLAFTPVAMLAADHAGRTGNPTTPSRSADLVIPSGYYSPELRLDVSLSHADADQIFALLKGPQFWACRPEGTVNLYEQVSTHLRHKNSEALRKRFSTTYDGLAAKQFSAALASGDALLMTNIAFQYRTTPTGERAVRMAILMLADKGQDYAAAHLFKGWLADQPTDLCREPALYPFLYKGLTLMKTAGLFTDAQTLTAKLQRCDDFKVGSVTAKTLKRHLSSAVPFDPSQNFDNSWYEKRGANETSAQRKTDTLKLAMTYGASGEEIDELFKSQSRLTPCQHLDVEYSYRELFAFVPTFPKSESVASLTPEGREQWETFIKLYPMTTSRLFREVKEPLLSALLEGGNDSYAQAFELIKPFSEGVMPELISALSSEFPITVERAFETLQALETKAAAATPVLIAKLEDPNRLTRRRAIQTLGVVGGDGSKVIARMLNGGDDEDNEIAIYAMSRTPSLSPETVGVLVQYLESANPQRADSVAQALAYQRAEGLAPFVGELLSLFEKHPELEHSLIAVFAKQGPRAAKAVPALIGKLDRATLLTKSLIIPALGRIGVDAQAAIPHVVQYIEDEELGAGAAEALSRIGVKALPDLEKVLHQPVPQEKPGGAERLKKLNAKIRAASALATIGGPGVPALVNALSDPEPLIVNAALNEIGNLGHQANVAIPTLYAQLEKSGPSDSRLARLVGEVLGRMGTAAKPKIVEALRSPSRSARIGATAALERCLTEPDFAVPLLATALKDTEPIVRILALDALDDFGDNARMALAEIVAATADPSPVMRKAAFLVLRRIRSAESVTALEKGLTDGDPAARYQALQGFEMQGALAQPAIPSLLKCLESGSVSERRTAFDILSPFQTPAVLEGFEKRQNTETDSFLREALQHEVRGRKNKFRK